MTGLFGSSIVCSVRNVGYVRHAGEIMHRAFGSIGSAGGHRSMAKAVIPLGPFKQQFSASSGSEIEDNLIALFFEAKDGTAQA